MQQPRLTIVNLSLQCNESIFTNKKSANSYKQRNQSVTSNISKQLEIHFTKKHQYLVIRLEDIRDIVRYRLTIIQLICYHIVTASFINYSKYESLFWEWFAKFNKLRKIHFHPPGLRITVCVKLIILFLLLVTQYVFNFGLFAEMLMVML